MSKNKNKAQAEPGNHTIATNHGGKVKIKALATPAGGPFANLKEGDVVDRVPCPTYAVDKHDKAVWVAGVSEPVRLLSGEYELV